jgi:hypothetical protein
LILSDTSKGRIAYLCPRVNYLKVYIPVIVEQLKNRFMLEPILVVPASVNTFWGNKNDTAATIDKLGGYDVLNQIMVIEVKDEKHLLELLYKYNIKVVVEISAYTNKEIYSYVMPESKKRGIKWCVLGSNGDELRVVDIDGGKLIENWDLITVVNNLWRKWVVKYLEEINPQKAKYAQEAVAIGNPEFDQIPQLKFEREKILKKYGVPTDKKIIFMALPADYSIPVIYKMLFFNKFITKIINLPVLKQLFKKYVCGRKNALIKNWDRIRSYVDVLKKIRKFSDRNNALIICKRRHKDKQLKRCERKYIDMIFEEGEFYPFRTLELLSIADVYIGFESLCFLEAIGTGKPAINLISPLRLYFSDAGLNGVYWNKLWLDDNAMFKIKDVSEVYNMLKDEDWNRLCKKMEGSLSEQIEKYNSGRRQEFLKTFFGGSEFNSAGRFLNAVEKIL